MDWELRILQALEGSRPGWDEPPDWRAVLALYEGLAPDEAAALDRTVVRMIDLGYRNPHASREPGPFDQIEVSLPAGMAPADLLCIEAAVLVAAERGLGDAYFPFLRLMSVPTWHVIQGRLTWLAREALDAQRRLSLTRAGRGLGALLGLAAADALGCTVEFMSREAIRARWPEGHREIVGGGPFGFPAGDWTDDTAMAVAVGRGILEQPDDPVDAVGRHFVAWFQSGPPDVGNTCRTAINAFLRLGSWEAASAAVRAELGQWAAGNGALMRTLPAALAYGPDPAQAIRIGRMTHPHPESDAAIAVYHRTVDALLEGAAPAEALEAGLAPLPGAEPEVGAAIADLARRLSGLASRSAERIRSGGYVVETLEAALWAFLRTDSLEECVVLAVNLGDDADTVGAVAGGLAGAAYGPGAVPRRWSQALRRRAVIDELAAGLYGVFRARQGDTRK
ncbi:ADP-ribosylglycohydrolase family protein [Symbiobacterium thermophilum]|uniref:Putative dinitrogenase reductase activating glycohydrolase n=1 Tax=Symbiobacterium thermophilum (strain DSM 24528 / JCM 14929 / IAM 14863 / T) TaxID=292459 RepID=Q67P92_SYMTH|nr:ADP-ribosylglycohydrolase family protein [Symbiobacterium thermophilum]BAD40501.1 putative dinitrogenase reductase activating glycohydrolase [Symbiobacterium thermophilum IAM 14863]